MSQRSVTIVDLADSLGLSKTTVADALNGSGRVSEATRSRVLEAARQRGYMANRAAQQLRTRSVGAIGLYVPPQVRNMAFYMPFAFGAADEASHHAWDLTLITRWPQNGKSAHQVDGVIVIDALPGDPVVRRLIDLPIPIVTAGRNADIPPDRLAGVIEIEHERNCGIILNRLKALGASHPAFVSPVAGDDLSWSRQLQRGYKSWCRRNRSRPCLVTTPTFPSTDDVAAAVAQVLSDPDINAVLFAWQDIATRAAIQFEHVRAETGRSVALASVVSSTDHFNGTYLTALDLRPYPFGQAAAKLLHEAIAEPSDQTVYRIHEPELVEQ
ncbi:LacI family DNA-binding transcriptional regulator [Dactylosporangium sucinum]|uniref:LacI-family transcriptional regulator n=1 Tax=Dactylosporangium sucinum TaxID=1424081 RepID=A0A917WVR0_9ACTN|nr:LacI family DNA-binding transcriptional regulator [Dactylosporangium sucinum]GGM36928.1 putative LacI-family transcriptional regulator [Dactylosporangium sucinum]